MVIVMSRLNYEVQWVNAENRMRYIKNEWENIQYKINVCMYVYICVYVSVCMS